MSKAIEIFDKLCLLILIELDDFWSNLTLILGAKITSKSFKNRFGCPRTFQKAPGGSMRLPRGAKSVSEEPPKCLRDGLQPPLRTHIIMKIHHASTPWKINLKTLVLPEKAWNYMHIGRTLRWQMVIQKRKKASYHYRSNSLWQLITQKRNSLWQLINQRRKSPCQAI